MLAALLTSCQGSGELRSAVVLERNSPAVSSDGVLAEDVGIETIGGVFTPLLKKGCASPCKFSDVFTTSQDNQGEIQISLFRGQRLMAADNHSLGLCHIVNIPPAPRGMSLIRVTVELVGNQIQISAVDDGTKRPMAIQCGSKPAV